MEKTNDGSQLSKRAVQSTFQPSEALSPRNHKPILLKATEDLLVVADIHSMSIMLSACDLYNSEKSTYDVLFCIDTFERVYLLNFPQGFVIGCFGTGKKSTQNKNTAEQRCKS